MTRAFFYAILAISTGCSSPAPEEVAPVLHAPDGVYKADDLMIARGVFLPHEDSRPYAEFESDAENLIIHIDVPEFGLSVLVCSTVPPKYAAYSSWEGTFEGYQVIVNMDFHRRIFLIIGDDGKDGKSNSIGWRFDLPYGNG